MAYRRDTPDAGIAHVTDAGTGVDAAPEQVDVAPVPSDPKERQAYIQSMIAEVSERFYGQDLDVVIEALTQRIAASGLDPQPVKWVTDTASEIVEGRHVVVDRQLGIRPGGETDRVPEEARHPRA